MRAEISCEGVWGKGGNVAEVLMFVFVLFPAASEQRAMALVLDLQKSYLEFLCFS